MKLLSTLIPALLLAFGAVQGAACATFRWSAASDISSLDIHAHNNGLVNGVHAAIYESLVYRNSKNLQPEPQLAVSWQEITPTQIRFNLRAGVRFSDGTPLDADDVVFSIHRAMAKASNYRVYTQGIEKVVKVNDRVVDFILKGPNPVLLNQLTELRIMSRAWAERNNSLDPKDIRAQSETFAHRNAMGTGPFLVREWKPDQRLVLARNPNHWAKGDAKEGSITEVVFTPISSDATRIAALLSGEVDFVLDPSPQDLPRIRSHPQLKIIEGVENRTILLGMDQHREELPGSNIKGKNPLKDLRVRTALYQAIDIDTIHKVTMRGLSQPTGTIVAPQVTGWTQALHKRMPYDPANARALLAKAGYPIGFEAELACPNNRYINDEETCQAIAALWARIGVKIRLRAQPSTLYFPMIQRYEASIYLLGWSVPTFDALYTLQSLTRSVGSGGDGHYNAGRYKNERMDHVVDRIKLEADPLIRGRLLTEALQISNDSVSYIPLYNAVVPWAMKKSVETVHRADNRLDWRKLSMAAQ